MEAEAASVTEIEAVLSTDFLEAHPTEAARVLETLPPEDAASVLRAADETDAALVLRRMAPTNGAACIALLDDAATRALIEHLPLDSAALLLRVLPEAERRRVLDLMSRRSSEPLRRLLEYPPGTVGAVMDPNVFVVANDLSAQAARDNLDRHADTAIYYVYVVDREQKLVGVLTLPELMLEERDRSIASAMNRSPVAVAASASHFELVRHPGWRRFHALPVVDAEGRLLGIIRYETLRELEDELGGGESGGKGGLDLAVSLSELYVKGLTGLVTGLAPRSAARGKTSDPSKEGKGS